MRKSIATVSVSGSLPAKLEAIAAAKFAGIELFDADLTSSTLRAEEVATRCRDLGLGIDLFQPLRDCVGLRPAAFTDRIRFARAKFDVMERLGADRALACSAVHPDAVADLDLAAEQLAALGVAAAEHGFTIAFETLAWGSCLNRVGQAWDVVRRVASANVGVAVDTFHMLARGDDGTSLVGIPGSAIAYLQIADAPHLSMDALEWSRHHRCFPGQGSLDVLGVVAAVVEAGYRGPLSLEVFSDIVREADPRDTARDAMRSLLYLEEQLRRRWNSEPSGGHTRPSVELFDPPPAPSAPRASFVEIAVQPSSPALPELLTGMGFRSLATDGASDFAWWQNGGANVLLGGASDLALRRPTPTARPSVTSLGLAVDDPDRLAARAEALSWQPTVVQGRGRLSLSSTQSPVGVTVMVTPTGGLDELSEFAGLPELARSDEHDGWDGVDHVGTVVDVDRSDAEVSFYRTLFGLTPGPVSEFIDPSGRLRSRILQPAGEGLRVVLNIAVRSGGRAQPGINQLAFHCTDLLRRVEEMRGNAVPLIDVPGGYYDDLQARLDVEPALLVELRRLGVMYDRDGVGELLHAYTPLIGGRFYIELLERRGGYSGFGAANTPTRLAMQALTPWVG